MANGTEEISLRQLRDDTCTKDWTIGYAMRYFQGAALDSAKRTVAPRGKGKSLVQSVKAPSLQGVHVLTE